MIQTYVPLPNLAPGEHSVEAKYVDRNDKTNGPYTLKFSTDTEQLAQGKQMLEMTKGSWLMFRDYDGKVLLYFSQLLSYRPIIKEIRYSINSDALDQTYKFKPSDKMYEVGNELPYIAVAADSQYAAVQVTYKDGSKSDVQKVIRQR
jgi:hypothetical protein